MVGQCSDGAAAPKLEPTRVMYVKYCALPAASGIDSMVGPVRCAPVLARGAAGTPAKDMPTPVMLAATPPLTIIHDVAFAGVKVARFVGSPPPVAPVGDTPGGATLNQYSASVGMSPGHAGMVGGAGGHTML